MRASTLSQPLAPRYTQPMSRIFSRQFVRYASVGILNLTLSLTIFNFLIWITGVTRGIEITLFSIITFTIVVTHSFFWNKFHVFKDKDAAHREYMKFFVVSGATSLLNVGIISLLVNGIGAPDGLSERLWANIAVIITIPVAVLCNFLGYSFFVFGKSSRSFPPAEV